MYYLACVGKTVKRNQLEFQYARHTPDLGTFFIYAGVTVESV